MQVLLVQKDRRDRKEKRENQGKLEKLELKDQQVLVDQLVQLDLVEHWYTSTHTLTPL